MQLSLLKNDAMHTCILPEKCKGRYWITHLNDDGYEEQMISVEGIEGEWKLKSNKYAVIQDDAFQRVKEVKVEPLKFYNIHLTRTNEQAWLYSEPITDDRKQFAKLVLPDNGKLVIGRSEACDIQYVNTYTSSRHAELLINGSQLTIQDLDSSNGTFVNGVRVKQRVLQPGDMMDILGLKLIIGPDFIAMNNPDGQVAYNQQLLRDYIKQQAYETFDNDYDDEETVFTTFYRSPRFKRDINRPTIKIDPPPSPNNQEQMPLILMLGPSITMGIGAMFMGLFMMQNVLSSGGSMFRALPSMVMAISMLLGAVLWPLLSRKYEAKRRAEKEQIRQEKYSAYLQEMEEKIANECAHQKQILHENYVTIDDCVARIMQGQRNMWERTHGHNDFLRVRLGLGNLSLDADLKFPEKKFSLEDDNLQDELFELAEKPRVLDNVPITLSLAEDWISGVIGSRDSVTDLAKGILLQLISLHSYDEIKLVFLFDKKDMQDWAFVKWLPHVWGKDSHIRFIANDRNEVKELSAYLEKELAKRESSRDEELQEISPHYIIFAINMELAAKSELINAIYKSKKHYGFSVVHLCEEIVQLPKECSLVIDAARNDSKLYDKDDITGQYISFKPDLYMRHDEQDLALKLANTQLSASASDFRLPDMVTFLELFEVGKVEHLNALSRWKENDPTLSLETPIGVGTNGEWFKLDLHEKFHGPHGLIAGMTGSGKSEFIITYIMSLAVNYHPYEVAFILIDYKGGGMANAFTGLPHLAGTITNLDGAAVNRSLVSIQSELKRRQAIFSETSKQVNISNLDIYKYQKLFREGQVEEPVPHLFIISDEFAELKTQQPEFMEQLVSAARIGRSLGIHLILATQKPSGVVDDQIWSNSRFRVCLKVQEKADSMDMIKRPDAAELAETGRYYVQVGFNELFELGQSAWGGAPYYPSDSITNQQEEGVMVIDNLGRVVKDVRLDKRKQMTPNPSKQIDEVNQYLIHIAKEEHIVVRPLWLEPIPGMIVLDELKKKYTSVDTEPGQLNPLIGEVDDPAKQNQFALRFSIADGNAVIYGSAGSGKTTFLTTLMFALIQDYTPDDVHMYLLDFSAETLRNFATAPHVGDVLFSHDSEKVSNLIKKLHKEIELRKKLFADYGGDYHSYLRTSGEQLPSIIIAIHNFTAFTEVYEDHEEDIAYLSREGLKYGIYFILTALTTNGVRYRTLQNFKQLYVLQLNDVTDYASALGSVDGVYPSKHKGRGIYKTDQVYEFQIAHINRESNEIWDQIRKYCHNYANAWNKPAAAKIPILPDRVDLDYLAEHWDSSHTEGIPVGVDKQQLSVATYPFAQRYIQFVLSQNNDQTSFLQELTEVIAEQNVHVTLVDPEGRLHAVQRDNCTYYAEADLEHVVNELFALLVERNNSYKDAKTAGQPLPQFDTRYVIVDSFSALLTKLPDDSRDKLKVLLEKGEAHYHVHIVCSDSVNNLSSYALDTWFTSHVSMQDGIWTGSGISDQYQMKLAKVTSDLYQDIGEQFGYIVSKGKVRLIKLLSSHAAWEVEPVG